MVIFLCYCWKVQQIRAILFLCNAISTPAGFYCVCYTSVVVILGNHEINQVIVFVGLC